MNRAPYFVTLLRFVVMNFYSITLAVIMLVVPD
jgi:hypothetical protein